MKAGCGKYGAGRERGRQDLLARPEDEVPALRRRAYLPAMVDLH